jgi:hypothetical protein
LAVESEKAYQKYLPRSERIKFKILILTYKPLNDIAPSYLKELLVPYTPARTLRSANKGVVSWCTGILKGFLLFKHSVINRSWSLASIIIRCIEYIILWHFKMHCYKYVKTLVCCQPFDFIAWWLGLGLALGLALNWRVPGSNLIGLYFKIFFYKWG